MFPSQIMNLINAKVGLQRIQKFLEQEEMTAVAIDNIEGDEGVSSGRKFSGKATEKLPLLLDARAGADALLGVSEVNSNMDTRNGRADLVDPSVSVLIRNGFFSWGALGKEKYHVLKHINLKLLKGQLVMIVGEVSTMSCFHSNRHEDLHIGTHHLQVGCGKSSLLQSLLGEMSQQSSGGTVVVRGSVAYTSQVPMVTDQVDISSFLPYDHLPP